MSTKPTKAQLHALKALWCRSPMNCMSYKQFRKSAQMDPRLGCLMVPFCGMWAGIEWDGYTRS